MQIILIKHSFILIALHITLTNCWCNRAREAWWPIDNLSITTVTVLK